jgi:hypothetical protein
MKKIVSLYAYSLSELWLLLTMYGANAPASTPQNVPNPFRANTTISYKLGDESPVDLEIFNIKGQLVKRMTLAPKELVNTR